MLQITGTVTNVLVTPEGTNKEGEKFGGYHQVQLLCEETLRNGETRMSLQNLRADNYQAFEQLRGRAVRVSVGLFVRNSQAVFYLPKDAQPEEVTAAQ